MAIIPLASTLQWSKRPKALAWLHHFRPRARYCLGWLLLLLLHLVPSVDAAAAFLHQKKETPAGYHASVHKVNHKNVRNGEWAAVRRNTKDNGEKKKGNVGDKDETVDDRTGKTIESSSPENKSIESTKANGDNSRTHRKNNLDDQAAQMEVATVASSTFSAPSMSPSSPPAESNFKLSSTMPPFSVLNTPYAVLSGMAGTLYEAESFDAKGGNTVVATNHPGFTSTGFVDYGNSGSFAQWDSINAPSADDYQLVIRYAVGDPSGRKSELRIQGVIVAELEFAYTGGWTIWNEQNEVVSLSQGNNSLRIQSINDGPNIDNFQIFEIATTPTQAPITPAPVLSSGIYEAEDASLSNSVAVATTHSGFSGTGYVDYGSSGSYVQWSVVVPETGMYQLVIRYAVGDPSGRKSRLSVGMVATELDFAFTGAWTSWGEESYAVPLNNGVQSIKIESINDGPNIDYLVVEFAPQESLYEAEESSNQAGVSFSTQHPGFSGTGYMDFGSSASFLQWEMVSVETAGLYQLIVRYAVGDQNGRSSRLYVRNVEVSVLPFSFTGGWADWSEQIGVVSLNPGSNIIRIESIGDGPNIDYIQIGASNPTPTPPTPTPPTPTPPTPTPPTPPPQSDFMLKMFWEEGMRWQESSSEKKWCVDIDSGDDSNRMEIKECRTSDDKQRWDYSSRRLIPHDDDNKCWTHSKGSSGIRLRTCDGSESQGWSGLRTDKKFQLKPANDDDECVSQQHHPRSGERVKLVDCETAEDNDSGVYDDTSHWVTGRWNGH